MAIIRKADGSYVYGGVTVDGVYEPSAKEGQDASQYVTDYESKHGTGSATIYDEQGTQLTNYGNTTKTIGTDFGQTNTAPNPLFDQAAYDKSRESDKTVLLPNGQVLTGTAAQAYGNGSIYDTMFLSQAQPPTSASQVKPIGGVNIPSVSSSIGNISNAIAGASGASSYIETQQQMAADRQKQIEAQIKALNTSTQPLLDRLLGSKSPMEARLAAQQETGIDPQDYFADQKSKIAEIESLTGEYNATKAAMEQQLAATQDKLASNNFINNQTAQIQRNAAPKLNQMSANINAKAATLQALQGNFNEAQNFVNQAVQDATAEFKYNLDVYTTFYEMNKSVIESLDAPYQKAYEAALGMAEMEYKRAVEEAQEVGKLMMDNPKAGITITDTFASAAQKVARAGGSLDYLQEQRLRTTSGGSVVSSDTKTYAQAYLDGQIEITSVPQNQRAAVLAEANRIASEALGTPEPSQTSSTTPPPPTIGKYNIKPGDTFATLASQFGVTTQQMIAANPGVSPTNLQIGQAVNVPQKQVSQSAFSGGAITGFFSNLFN